MEIFLLEKVKGLGEAFEFAEAKPGYANFLISHKKALDANKSKQEVEDICKKIMVEKLLAEKRANELLKKLNGFNIIYECDLTPKGTISKAITKQDIADRLPFKFDKKNINIENKLDKLTKTGVYNISFNVGCGLTAMGKVTVSVAD